MVAVPTVEPRFFAGAKCALERLYSDDILLAEVFSLLNRRDDRASRSVAHAAAVEETERIRDDRRIDHLVFGDGLAQVRFRIRTRRSRGSLPTHEPWRA